MVWVFRLVTIGQFAGKAVFLVLWGLAIRDFIAAGTKGQSATIVGAGLLVETAMLGLFAYGTYALYNMRRRFPVTFTVELVCVGLRPLVLFAWIAELQGIGLVALAWQPGLQAWAVLFLAGAALWQVYIGRSRLREAFTT